MGRSLESNGVPNSHLLDEQLYLRFLDGDSEALVELFGRYRVRLSAFIWRIVKNSHATEDILSEVMLKFLNNPSMFDTARKFQPFIFLVARSATLDFIRRVHDVLDEAERPRFSEDLAPDECVILGETCALVHRALRKLPRDQREVLWLNFFEGVKHEEIAKKKNLPLGTVKSKIRRAQEKLRIDLARPFDVHVRDLNNDCSDLERGLSDVEGKKELIEELSKSLKPQDIELLRMWHVYGYSIPEMAEALSVSQIVVHSRLKWMKGRVEKALLQNAHV